MLPPAKLTGDDNFTGSVVQYCAGRNKSVVFVSRWSVLLLGFSVM